MKKPYNANEIRAKILRKKILQLIAENYVMSASLISHTLLLSYATVLRHLRVLNEEGYIELYKQGRTLYAKIKDNVKQIQILNSELGLLKSIGSEQKLDEGPTKPQTKSARPEIEGPTKLTNAETTRADTVEEG